jgi:hypothetical protein
LYNYITFENYFKNIDREDEVENALYILQNHNDIKYEVVKLLESLDRNPDIYSNMLSYLKKQRNYSLQQNNDNDQKSKNPIDVNTDNVLNAQRFTTSANQAITNSEMKESPNEIPNNDVPENAVSDSEPTNTMSVKN